jgi:heptosyltransferase-1
MTAPRVLFVKLSSLGDVVHNLPAVTDLARARPGARIHWAVEEAYAPLVGLHPAVERAIAVALRGARSRPFASASWRSLAAARRALRHEPYDFIVDTQGLAKSGAVAACARGPVFGPDSASARERLAARFYDVRIAVPRAMHAVQRNRRLVSAVFGLHADGPPDYGIRAPGPRPAWAPAGPYYVALQAASRAAKRWDESRWTALAARLAERGFAAVYPGGSAEERAAAVRLAAASPEGMAAPPMTLLEASSLLAAAEFVVGVDTGLTHLAVALGRPTIGLYRATDPGLTGLLGDARAINLGGPGRAPDVDEVLRALGFGATGAA